MSTISYSTTFTHTTLTHIDKPPCWSAIVLHPTWTCTGEGTHIHTRVHTHMHMYFPPLMSNCAALVTSNSPLECSAAHCYNFGKINKHILFGVPYLFYQRFSLPWANQAPHICCDSNCYSLFIPSINKLHQSPRIFLESFGYHSRIRHLAHS